jgi:S-methylmethionine-dependent homocysteine/selenocysteine methylase
VLAGSGVDLVSASMLANTAEAAGIARAARAVGVPVAIAFASRLSHAELDESEVFDEGNPAELGGQLADLHARGSRG